MIDWVNWIIQFDDWRSKTFNKVLSQIQLEGGINIINISEITKPLNLTPAQVSDMLFLLNKHFTVKADPFWGVKGSSISPIFIESPDVLVQIEV